MEWTDYDNDYNDDPWLLRLVGPVIFAGGGYPSCNGLVDRASTHRDWVRGNNVKPGRIACKRR